MQTAHPHAHVLCCAPSQGSDSACGAVMRTNAPAAIACAVVHNKLKPKEASLPEGVIYMVCFERSVGLVVPAGIGMCR